MPIIDTRATTPNQILSYIESIGIWLAERKDRVEATNSFDTIRFYVQEVDAWLTERSITVTEQGAHQSKVLDDFRKARTEMGAVINEAQMELLYSVKHEPTKSEMDKLSTALVINAQSIATNIDRAVKNSKDISLITKTMNQQATDLQVFRSQFDNLLREIKSISSGMAAAMVILQNTNVRLDQALINALDKEVDKSVHEQAKAQRSAHHVSEANLVETAGTEIKMRSR